MVTDKTGRKLKIGQVVDVVMLGTFHGKVIDIKEVPFALSSTQTLSPHAVIQIITTPYIDKNGAVADVYILQEPDPKEKSDIKLVTH